MALQELDRGLRAHLGGDYAFQVILYRQPVDGRHPAVLAGKKNEVPPVTVVLFSFPVEALTYRNTEEVERRVCAAFDPQGGGAGRLVPLAVAQYDAAGVRCGRKPSHTGPTPSIEKTPLRRPSRFCSSTMPTEMRGSLTILTAIRAKKLLLFRKTVNRGGMCSLFLHPALFHAMMSFTKA